MTSGQTNKSFESYLRNEAANVLPEPNFLPPSLYLLKVLLRVQPILKLEQHVCIDECEQFPHLVPKEYRHHLEDRCSCCGKLRFRVEVGSNGKTKLIRPVRRFWYFTLDYAIQCFFGDPAFSALRGTERDRPNGLYQSREADRLERLGVPIRSPDASLWSVGCDGGQVFDAKKHSTFMVALRCEQSFFCSLG